MERTFVYEYSPSYRTGYAYSWRLFDFIKRAINGNLTEKTYKKLLYFFDVHSMQAEIKMVITEFKYETADTSTPSSKLYRAKMYINIVARRPYYEFVQSLEDSGLLYNIKLSTINSVELDITVPVKWNTGVVEFIKILESTRKRRMTW